MRKVYYFFLVLFTIFICTAIFRFAENRILFKAIENEDVDGVKCAIENGAYPNLRKYIIMIHEIFPPNQTPLTAACKSGNLEIVELLLKYGADVNLQGDITGVTPLLAALRNRNPERFAIALLLLEYGADYNYFREDTGVSPLAYSLVVYEDDTAETRYQSVLLLDTLLQKDAVFSTYSNHTMLTFAAVYNNLDAIVFLVEEKNCDPTEADPRGETPLSVATEKGYDELIKYLTLINNEG